MLYFILYPELFFQIGPFLLQCITEVTGAGKTLEYLTLLVNVIKFHPAYIDEEIITGFVALVLNLTKYGKHFINNLFFLGMLLQFVVIQQINKQ